MARLYGWLSWVNGLRAIEIQLVSLPISHRQVKARDAPNDIREARLEHDRENSLHPCPPAKIAAFQDNAAFEDVLFILLLLFCLCHLLELLGNLILSSLIIKTDYVIIELPSFVFVLQVGSPDTPFAVSTNFTFHRRFVDLHRLRSRPVHHEDPHMANIEVSAERVPKLYEWDCIRFENANNIWSNTRRFTT